jgi:hypothetical protein
MDTEDKINKLAELIRQIVDKDNKMEGQYSMPYSTAEDDYADWKVTFKVIRVSLWESKKYNQCKYGASVYLKADVMVGFEGDWEGKFNIWDLPSWVKDDVEDKILDNIDQFLPMVCSDLTFV